MTERSQKKLAVTVQDEEKGILWQGAATSVSGVNSQGPFDVLPLHANFITLTENTPITIRESESANEIKPHTAVLFVKEGKVNIYIVRQES